MLLITLNNRGVTVECNKKVWLETAIEISDYKEHINTSPWGRSTPLRLLRFNVVNGNAMIETPK